MKQSKRWARTVAGRQAPGDDGAGLLTDDQAEAVILATVRGYDPEPVGEDVLCAALREAEKLAISAAMLELITSGAVSLTIDDDGELLFSKRGAE